MEYDVTIDRDKFLGGSDIPVIMGISPFKSRWRLLKEKASIEESDFTGNKYTEYGNKMEGKIRDFINKMYSTCYEPNRKTMGDLRFHCDGDDGWSILEIKTTSNVHDNLEDYKLYLVQLLAYMEAWKYDKGLLAVYKRPDDFSLEFDVERLEIWFVDINDYTELLNEIHAEIERFRADLARLRENPLLTEEDFQPNELVTLSNKVLAFEKQIAEYKEIEKQYKDMKQKLYEAMEKYGVKSWETLNGAKITKVEAVKGSVETVKKFNEAKFGTDYPDIYKEYCEDVTVKKTGRSGYVKITL